MKRNDSFCLTEIAGVPYLLPFGQMIADHKPGICLNETGIFLWELLAQDRSMEELVLLCAQHYELNIYDGSEESLSFKSEIEDYVKEMYHYGYIADTSPENASVFISQYISIGGICLKLVGPANAFSTKFNPYLTEDHTVCDQTICVFTHPPKIRQNGKVLLHNEELIIMDYHTETVDSYTILFPTSKQLIEVHLKKDGSLANFYCLSPFNEQLVEDIFHAIRLVFLYLAQQKNIVAIHSASILYRDNAWLFSASSGTGKSTHTNLWNRLFDIPVINGDLNLIAFQDERPVIHGSPWCGTSGISNPNTYPLGGIILLKQAPTDHVIELAEDQKQLQVMQRFISPSWTEALLKQNCNFVSVLAPQILICKLLCTKEDSAAITMKEYIDKGF